ncbi:hypothetical protein M407DRAFT_24315 [Tulasnella calospora MUT 4182]|uniref:Uncharacterized protein n=1 Tax=Tulasnella calospora MUT 4182 TaxID=1051891 RepID=A0A0C3QJJ3_9AGAM|nr:hypothetical protein M407DRAFT_24315 [Tulasnella calospora MUT 4182]
MVLPTRANSSFSPLGFQDEEVMCNEVLGLIEEESLISQLLPSGSPTQPIQPVETSSAFPARFRHFHMDKPIANLHVVPLLDSDLETAHRVLGEYSIPSQTAAKLPTVRASCPQLKRGDQQYQPFKAVHQQNPFWDIFPIKNI